MDEVTDAEDATEVVMPAEKPLQPGGKEHSVALLETHLLPRTISVMKIHSSFHFTQDAEMAGRSLNELVARGHYQTLRVSRRDERC